MSTTISLEVDSETAQAFAMAPVEERRKLQLLLGLRLRELTAGPSRPLNDVMNDIGQNAETRGLTPELLDTLLRDV